jgi:hypothetical protein
VQHVDIRKATVLHAQIFRRVGWSAVRLLLVPGICEACFDGGIAMPIFGMPPTFAFALGFILKAVGPALVIQSMFEVQQKRLGTIKCAAISCAPHQTCPVVLQCMCFTPSVACLRCTMSMLSTGSEEDMRNIVTIATLL